jgi:hypothetical protein
MSRKVGPVAYQLPNVAGANGPIIDCTLFKRITVYINKAVSNFSGRWAPLGFFEHSIDPAGADLRMGSVVILHGLTSGTPNQIEIPTAGSEPIVSYVDGSVYSAGGVFKQFCLQAIDDVAAVDPAACYWVAETI